MCIIGMTSPRNELVQLNDCNCPGQNLILIYECTVCGEGATEWKGSLFDCPNRNIILRHGQFGDDSITGECHSSNGTVMLTAQSIGPGELDINTNGFCYTSQLRLQNVTADDNNKTVACNLVDEQSERAIGNITVTVITGAPIERI